MLAVCQSFRTAAQQVSVKSLENITLVQLRGRKVLDIPRQCVMSLLVI